MWVRRSGLTGVLDGINLLLYPDISDILDFCAQLLMGWNKKSFGLTGLHISASHDPIGNIWVGNHPSVYVLVSGILNKGPPQPSPLLCGM